MKDLIKLMDPKYIEVTGILHLAEESVFILIVTTVVRVLNLNSWQNNVCLIIR